MIDPGKMNDRITLQKAGTIINPVSGWPEEGFVDLATVWSQFRPAGGREFREGNVAVGEERATFTIQWRDNLDQADRLIHAGTIWNIRSVSRVGWKEALDLNATTTGQDAP